MLGRWVKVAEGERWMVNTLEVIINHYKELENEIREVRQEYEAILRSHNQRVLLNAVKQKEAN